MLACACGRDGVLAVRPPIVNLQCDVDHPTQALADIYGLLKWRPGFFCQPDIEAADKVRIGVVGVPGRMRTVRSLLTLLGLFSHAISELVLISDEKEPFSDGQRAELEEAGLTIRLASDLDTELPGLDVVYINTIAWVGDDYEELGSSFRLDSDSQLKPEAIILHPLARGAELDRSLDDTPHNWYFAQARGAVFMRMALLSSILKSFT